MKLVLVQVWFGKWTFVCVLFVSFFIWQSLLFLSMRIKSWYFQKKQTAYHILVMFSVLEHMQPWYRGTTSKTFWNVKYVLCSGSLKSVDLFDWSASLSRVHFCTFRKKAAKYPCPFARGDFSSILIYAHSNAKQSDFNSGMGSTIRIL